MDVTGLNYILLGNMRTVFNSMSNTRRTDRLCNFAQNGDLVITRTHVEGTRIVAHCKKLHKIVHFKVVEVGNIEKLQEASKGYKKVWIDHDWLERTYENNLINLGLRLQLATGNVEL